MKIDKTPGHIRIEFDQDFNWFAAQRLRRIVHDASVVHLDLKNCKFVDTEGIVLLYEWTREGKEIQLTHAPGLLFELVDLLKLREALRLDDMT